MDGPATIKQGPRGEGTHCSAGREVSVRIYRKWTQMMIDRHRVVWNARHAHLSQCKWTQFDSGNDHIDSGDASLGPVRNPSSLRASLHSTTATAAID